MPTYHTILCTCGTSALTQAKSDPNLAPLVANGDVEAIARELARRDGAERVLGAEINSTMLLAKRKEIDISTLVLLHSDTDDGRRVAAILTRWFKLNAASAHWRVVSTVIGGLTATDPGAFRDQGLRNLVSAIANVIQTHGADNCAINATGGFKAQIAIAVLIGQALRIPVYYLYELFPTIISFPPMPVSLDPLPWRDHRALFERLRVSGTVECTDDIRREIEQDGVLRTLIETEKIDGRAYVALSAAGVVYDGIERVGQPDLAAHLPPNRAKPAPSVQLKDHGWDNSRQAILRLMERIVALPYVTEIEDIYWNPDLPQPSQCEALATEVDAVRCVYSNGAWTVHLRVRTTAREAIQREAALADLNAKLREWRA